MTKYSQIPDGGTFQAGGVTYKKLDAMYFVDLVSGFESAWSPMFEATIELNTGNATNVTSEDNPAFIVDPQSRLMKPNPNYEPPAVKLPSKPNPAEQFFGEMWSSGSFDCSPYEYEYMANTAILAVRTLNHIANILGIPYKEGHYDNILNHLNTSTKPKKAAKAKKAKE